MKAEVYWSFLDKILPASGHDDEVHNIQAIIDSLSLDILHEDLSYLTGEAIYSAIKHSKHSKKSKKSSSHHKRHDLSSVEYLLDLFVGLNEWLASQIETTTSTLPNQEHQQQNPASSSQEALHQRPVVDGGAKSPKRAQEDLNQKLSELSLQDTAAKSPRAELVHKVSVTFETEAQQEDEDIFASYLRRKEEEFKNKSKVSNTTLESTEVNMADKFAREPMTQSEWQEMSKK